MKTVGMIFCLVWSLPVLSQEYHPLIGESNEWYVLGCFEGCETEYFYLGDDSLIGSNIYKPLFQDQSDVPDAFLREDTIERKVYALNRIETEIVYLDFSLNEKDSIELRNLYNEYLGWCYVDSIKEINTPVGLRNAFYLR